MDDMVYIGFTKSEWVSILNAVANDEFGKAPVGFEAKVQSALCPDGHVEIFWHQERISTKDMPYFWGTAGCEVCGKSLWGVSWAEIENNIYRWYSYDDREEHLFALGSDDDPVKGYMDVQKFIRNPVGK